MPKVATLSGGVTIYQYYKDHSPPHFHAFRGDEEVLLQIADLGVEKGSIAAHALRDVQKWAGDHQAELALNWVFALAGLQLRSIAVP
jgi:hypothetical protein